MADAEEVKEALRKHGGKHSLFYAAEMGMAEVVEELIEEGADAALTNAVRARTQVKACTCTYSVRLCRLGMYIPST